MIYKLIYFFILMFTYTGLNLAQQSFDGADKGTLIKGKVYDSVHKVPLEYANIVIFSVKDSSQLTGTVTDKSGQFILKNIPFGEYYMVLRFMGYESNTIVNIIVTESKQLIDLADIYLKPVAINLDNILVEGKRSPISYQIDKKVIDVNEMQTVISGNAADVLENVPSVSVDIEGNVSLRGSTSFTVLIDGRPSVMDAQDALQQIPASSIETIEIITNPSAKYDPEGNAGIINIKLKKDKNYGLGGIVNGNAGINDKYGGDFLFEYRTQDLNYNLGMDYNHRFYPGSGIQRKEFKYGNNTSFLNSNGNSDRGRISFGLRGGIDININNSDYLSFGGRYGTRESQRNSVDNYLQWSDNNPQQFFYMSNNNRDRSGIFYALNTNYTHKFFQKGHELTGEFFISHHTSDESTISSEIQDAVQLSGRKTTESGPETKYRGKLDYVLPFSEKSKFQAGSQGEMELSKDLNGFYEFNPATNVYEFQQDFSNNNKYNRSELAIYSMYSNEWDNFGFQTGIRTEYTYRTIELLRTNQNFQIDRWDFFPSFHTSYKFDEGTQIMASYTRRIDRPRGWYLEPFYTWMDANNVRIGNPALIPEYIDSYEFGLQTFFGQLSFSNEFYYRVNHNKIERVRSVYAENVNLTTFDNVGTDYSLGSEFMLIFDPLKFWNINLMGNLYDYRIEANLNDVPLSRKSFNWSARMSNGFKIGESTQFQFNGRYRSPSVSSQGRREGYFSTDLALKQNLLGKTLSLTLQVRDLFSTAKHEFTSQGIDFYSYNYFTHESPVVMLNIRFNFNNYKKDERGGGQPDNGFGGEEDL